MGIHLDTGWKLWIRGLPSSETIDANGIQVQAPVRSFCILKPTMLPPDTHKKFGLDWRQIFSLLEGAPDMDISPAMDTDSILLSFSVGKQYLKARVSYVFESERATPDQWGISTWSKKVCRSSIMKDDNDSDKAHLPAATHRNRPLQQCHPRNRHLAATYGGGLLVEELSSSTGPNGLPPEEDGGDGRLPMQTDEEPATTNDATATNDSHVEGLLLRVRLRATAVAREVKRLRGRLMRRWRES